MSEKYALVIGLEKYQDISINAVKFAEADAIAIVDALKPHGFDSQNMKVLLNEYATKATIESQLRRFFAHLKSKDIFLFFYAGHGFADGDHNYLTCHDTQIGDIINTSISLQNIVGQIQHTPCEHIMLFLDSCHSGLKLDENMRNILTTMSEEELEKFVKDSEYHVAFASCKKDQVSYAIDQLKHGVWSYYIIKALIGDSALALSKNRYLTSNSLQNYLSIEVPQTLRKTRKDMVIQTPCMFGNITKDFIIADLKLILETKAVAQKPVIAQLKRVNLDGYIKDKIRTLSGFKKYYHTVPDEINDKTQQFVAKIGTTEVQEEADRLFKTIRQSLHYNRRDIELKREKGHAAILCKDFDVDVFIMQDMQNPRQYLLKTEIYNIRTPSIIMSDEFNRAFKNSFSELGFQFDNLIDIENIIDKIETLNSPNIDIEYPSDCSSCKIFLKSFDGVLEIIHNELKIIYTWNLRAIDLIQAFAKVQQLLYGLQVKCLPF